MGRREKKIDPGAGPLHAFAEDLRELRRGAPGAPSYRALSQRAGFSASALNAAASGEKLPTLDVTLAFVGACSGDAAAWEQRWNELAVRLRATHPELLAPPEQKEEATAPSELTPAADPPGNEGGAPAEPQAAAGPSPNRPMPDDTWRVEALHEGDPHSVGPYRLAGRLGTGAMGRVFLAATAAGRPVAVKVVRSDLADNPAFRRRFQREVEAARKVTSLYTAPVMDADTEAAAPWLATAFFPGPSLADLVQSAGPLKPTALRKLAAGIAEALTAIHAAGIVHRDLKPGNVLLSPDGPQVIDFGIAHAADASQLTATGARVGTPAFLPPEQAEHGQSLPAGDVFSLGALLVYAATGTTPFGEGSTSAVLYRVVHHEPDLTGLRHLDNDLRDLIAACLAKTPADRPTPQQIITRCAGTGSPAEPGVLSGVLSQIVTRRRRLAEQAIAKLPAGQSAKSSTLGPNARKRLIQSSIALPALIAVAVVTLLATHGGGSDQAGGSGGSSSAAGGTTGGITFDPGSSSSPTISATSATPSKTPLPQPANPGQVNPTPSNPSQVYPTTTNPVAPPAPTPNHPGGASSTQTAGNSTTCTASGVTCYAPQVTAVNSGTTHCPASQAWHHTTDSTGAAADWADANGPYECTSVDYSPRVTSATCSYFFYIPHNVGNGRLFIAYLDSSGAKWSAS